MKFADFKKHFQIDIPEILKQSIQETKQDIIDYNQKEQLSEGIDASSQSIYTIKSKQSKKYSQLVYSRYTYLIRKNKGLQVGAVDLKDTGAFWSSFDVKVTKERTEVIANWTIHGDDIRDNFDRRFDFLGLTQNSKENYAWSSLFPVFSKRLRDAFFSA